MLRARSGGIPIGFKLSAQHIEADIDFALEATADYIILDGRGGGTGAAPVIFRDHISVPTIPALARARRHLDARGRRDVTLIVTGPVGIATQRPELRARLPVEEAAERLHNFLGASVELMSVLARACGHAHLREFCADDLTTFDREMAHLAAVRYGGARPSA